MCASIHGGGIHTHMCASIHGGGIYACMLHAFMVVVSMHAVPCMHGGLVMCAYIHGVGMIYLYMHAYHSKQRKTFKCHLER